MNYEDVKMLIGWKGTEMVKTLASRHTPSAACAWSLLTLQTFALRSRSLRVQTIKSNPTSQPREEEIEYCSSTCTT